jgi:hypothetical protein
MRPCCNIGHGNYRRFGKARPKPAPCGEANRLRGLESAPFWRMLSTRIGSLNMGGRSLRRSGVRTEKFRKVTLTRKDIDSLTVWHSTYRPHLSRYVEGISKNMPLNDLWIAGFYFNSGIQRLAACFDRIPKLLGATGGNASERMKNINKFSYSNWEKVYKEINAYKHAVAGKAAGRSAKMAEAVEAFKELISVLNANKTKLATTYR